MSQLIRPSRFLAIFSYAFPASLSALSTFSGLSGSVLMRTPVALKIALAMAVVGGTLAISGVPYSSPAGIKTVLENLAKDNPKAKGTDPSSFTDPSILKSLEDSGFFKSV